MRSLNTSLFQNNYSTPYPWQIHEIHIACEDPLAYLGTYIEQNAFQKSIKTQSPIFVGTQSNISNSPSYSLLCVASHSGAGINMFNTSSFSPSQGLHMGRTTAAGGSARPKKERRPSAKVCSPSCLKEQPAQKETPKKSHLG